MKFERTQPKVSIVIASWFQEGQNGKFGENETAWFACECLNRLILNTPHELFELIIIDNGSSGPIHSPIPLFNSIPSNNTRAVSLSWYWSQADVLIRHKENLGFGPGYNTGFALARGEYVVCINNDIIVYPGWMDAMLKDFEKNDFNPPLGILMPALMKETKDAREALKIENPDLSQNYNAYGIKAEFGSCWMMKRELMELIKQKDGYYFDENFRCGFGEDRDWYRRVRREGFETYRTHKTRAYHQGNMTISKIQDRKQYTEPNREYLRKKWNIPEGEDYK